MCHEGSVIKRGDPMMHPLLGYLPLGRVIVASIVAALPLVAATVPAASGEKAGRNSMAGAWVCNAYGRSSNGRGTWHTVSGVKAGSQSAAQSSAVSECRRRYTGCQPSGCWQL